jgi:CRISPR-associated protein Cmr5
MIRNIEQGRAKKAYDYVLEIKKDFQDENAKKYKSYVKKLPMYIYSNGLGAALSFALQKGKSDNNNAWGRLYNQINEWIRENKSFLLGDNPSTDLAAVVISRNSPEYRALTIEIISLLTWLRRFAEGLIEGEPDEID